MWNQWAFVKTHHNYVFIQILWYIFVYNIIQTSCFCFLEKSTNKNAEKSLASGLYPAFLYAFVSLVNNAYKHCIPPKKQL